MNTSQNPSPGCFATDLSPAGRGVQAAIPHGSLALPVWPYFFSALSFFSTHRKHLLSLVLSNLVGRLASMSVL